MREENFEKSKLCPGETGSNLIIDLNQERKKKAAASQEERLNVKFPKQD